MSLPPTQRLYLRDPYTTEFETDVLERIDTGETPALVFAATYFYPESGGQPFDLGTIDGIPVTRVTETEDHRVLHHVERLPPADRVRCRIDWERRLDHMQQHSGQHILSAAFAKEAGAGTSSFHLGTTVSTIDLDKPGVTAEEIERAERTANDAVRRALPIRSHFVSPEEAQDFDLRKPPPDAASLRIVEVEGFDHQACCGTHPRTSAEVGPILVRGSEKFKQGTRVEFVCGERALRDYRQTVSRIRSLATILSAAESDLAATAEKLQEEKKVQWKELERLHNEVLLLRVEDWMNEAERLPGLELLVKTVSGAGPSELRTAATALTKKPGRVVLLGAVADGRAHLVFAASESIAADMASILKASLADVDGRGGGSPRLAQGGGPRTDGLPAALERAASIVKR
ncbi:MAG: alanyl-tRNA editing protein [Vicinamibacteria bacterium]